MEIRALEGIISIVALVSFVYGPWQWYCTDRARQNLFIKRARLFDLARTGEISFSDPAYIAIRMHIERLIRFAHNLTWLRLLVLLPKIRGSNAVQNADVPAMIASISNDDARDEVKKIYDSIGKQLLAMVVAKSPILLIFVCFGQTVLNCALAFARLNKHAEMALGKAVDRKFQLVQRTDSIIRAEAEALRV